MKIASFIATALLAVSAFATTTTVYHDYDGALRGINLNNACVTASTVQTIHATRNCTKLVPIVHPGHGEQDGYTEWVCEKWENSQMSHSRAFNRTVCLEYVNNGEAGQYCAQYGQKADFLPATIKVSVVTSNGEYDNFPGVTQNYTFPSCK